MQAGIMGNASKHDLLDNTIHSASGHELVVWADSNGNDAVLVP